MIAYEFTGRRTYTLAELRTLDPSRQAQALRAAEAYAGGSYATLDELAEGLQVAMEQDEVELEHYAIRRAGDADACYEMWVVATDNGLVFPVGSEDATAVHCAQSHFWSVDDGDAEAVELAAALDEIVPF